MKNSSNSYKWIVLLLVSLAYFFAQGTRQIYSCVLPQLKLDFASLGISDTQFGLIGSTFTLVFGLVMPFSGLAADMFRRKRVLIVGALLFATGIFVSGFATGLGMLFISYGILNAIGQSLMPPCNTSYISQYHVETRGTAFAIYQAAIYVGIIVCSVTSGYLAGLGEGGWRKAFWIFGLIALAWVVVMALFLKDSPKIGGDDNKVSVRDAARAFFAKPTALFLVAALGCYFFVTYAFRLWAPMFVLDRFPEMVSAKAAFHATFWFYVGALAGVTLGGRLSDKLKSVLPTVRVDVELVGIILCIPFVLVLAYAHSLPVVLGAILLFGFATGIYDSNLYAALFEVIDPRFRAVATGIFGCGGCIVGALGPAVTGWLISRYSMTVSMASLSVIAVTGGALILMARLFTLKKDMV